MADYIEREAALKVLCDACGNAACPKGLIPQCSYYEKMQSIPAADVRPVVRGKWMWELADNGWANHICSVCGYTKNTDIHVRMDYNFCPNCGADMREES